jgi:hypothetical protein
MTTQNLPPLPESDLGLAFFDEGGMQEMSGVGYTADQMHSYALAAVEAERDRQDACASLCGNGLCIAESAGQPCATARMKEAEKVLLFMQRGWRVWSCIPWDSMTDEANAENAWACERTQAPYCRNRGGSRLWTGANPMDALNASVADLSQEFPKIGEL